MRWLRHFYISKKILNNPVEDISTKCSFDHVSFLQKFHPFFIFLKHRTTNNPLKQNQRVPFSKHAHGAFFCVSWMEINFIYFEYFYLWKETDSSCLCNFSLVRVHEFNIDVNYFKMRNTFISIFETQYRSPTTSFFM